MPHTLVAARRSVAAGSIWQVEEPGAGPLGEANLNRVLAQVDVTYSNSMIEASWRSWKYSWLYLYGLKGESDLRRLIAFWVHAHNGVMPHSAFDGQGRLTAFAIATTRVLNVSGRSTGRSKASIKPSAEKG